MGVGGSAGCCAEIESSCVPEPSARQAGPGYAGGVGVDVGTRWPCELQLRRGAGGRPAARDLAPDRRLLDLSPAVAQAASRAAHDEAVKYERHRHRCASCAAGVSGAAPSSPALEVDVPAGGVETRCVGRVGPGLPGEALELAAPAFLAAKALVDALAELGADPRAGHDLDANDLRLGHVPDERLDGPPAVRVATDESRADGDPRAPHAAVSVSPDHGHPHGAIAGHADGLRSPAVGCRRARKAYERSRGRRIALRHDDRAVLARGRWFVILATVSLRHAPVGHCRRRRCRFFGR